MSEQPLKVVAVLGYGRSGSTLLGRILGGPEGFVHVGELVTLWRSRRSESRCGCGEPVDRCRFWTALVETSEGTIRELRRVHGAVMRLRHLRRLLRTDPDWPQLASFRTHLAELYRSVAQASGARVLIDSSKSSKLGAVLVNLDLDVRLVHLVRDPRATAYSWWMGKPTDPGGPLENLRYPAWRAARGWVAGNAASAWVLRNGGRPGIRVRYEDLVRAPRPVLGRILEAIGEPGAALPLVGERTARLGMEHAIGGNPDRFSRGDIDIRLDRRWLDGQRRSDRAVVTGLTLPWLLRYGYPVRAPRAA